VRFAHRAGTSILTPVSGPTTATIKRLFAVSGNRCAFPGCPLPLFDLESDTLVGEICHIKAQNPGGERYDPDQSDEERHGFDNLLLLCRAHHKVIDHHPDTYTVEQLLEMKALHQARHAGDPEPNDDVVRQFLTRLDVESELIVGDKVGVKIVLSTSAPPFSRTSPFMVEGIEGFVPRPHEYERLIAHLLDERCEGPVAITAALRGSGGYGKTMLARAICRDGRVRRAFKDGVLWVTLGQTPDVLGGLFKLYAALTGERPVFVDVEDAANALAARLGDGEYLLVVDDVWNHAHLRPFLRGGEHCARLVTTRNSSTLPPNARTVDVDAMQRNEAVELLGAGLPPADPEAMRALAVRLGEWPLLLKLANGALRHHVHDFHQPLPDALAYVHRALDRRGLTAFDARDPLERDQAVARTLGMSLEMLNPEERARYFELSIFPVGTDVPLATLEKLWGANGGLDELDVEDLCGRLFQLSLLLRFDLADGSVRLHDVMHDYLAREQMGNLPAHHDQLLSAYGVDRWAALPPDEPYLWRYLAYHLRGAGREDELYALLFDFDWLQVKLAATDVNALLADYELPSGGEGALRLVQGAVRLSAHVLARDQTQLAGQLLGRLTSFEDDGLQMLLERAGQWRGAIWLRPLTPSLTPPGGPLERTLAGHNGGVMAMAVMPDGKGLVSASYDQTLKVWDLEQGEEERTLAGHSGGVNAVAVTADGKRAVSGSADKTLKVWDLERGEEERMLVGHSSGVDAVAVTADGKRAVSGSADGTVKVWDVEGGEEERTLAGHSGGVDAVAVTADGKWAVSASEDGTLKVWDLERGEEERTLVGHTDYVRAVAVTADGKRAVSGSYDQTLKVWDLERGEQERTLAYHSGWVNVVVVTADGKRAVSGSHDGSIQVWDLERGEEEQTLVGHSGGVNAVAVTADGKRAVSASHDETLKVWDLERWQEERTLAGHSGVVRAVAVTADGKQVVSASYDGTLKVWDLERGEEERTLAGHSGVVMAVVVMPDGKRAVLGSYDQELKVWNLERGEQERMLAGHSGWVMAVAVTADGKRAVSGSADGTLKVWDLGRWQEERTLAGHTDYIRAVAVTADGKRAVSGSEDGTLKVWDLERGDEERTLGGHTGRIRAAAVTLDGNQAVSASDDQTLKVWDLEGGEAIATFSGDSALWACAIIPSNDPLADPLLIVVGESTGRVHFLRLEGA